MVKIPILKTTFLFIFLNNFFIILFKDQSVAFKIIPFIFLYLSGILLIINAKKEFKKIKSIHLYFKVILFLLCIWSLFTILRGINANSKDLITLFTHYQVGGWSWIMPLSIFFGLTVSNWLKLFPYLIKFLFLGIVFALFVVIFKVELGGSSLLRLFMIFLLTYYYHISKIRRFVILTSVIYILFYFFIKDSRSSAIAFSLPLFFSFLEYFRNKNIIIYKKVIFIMFFLLITFLVLIKAGDIYNSIASDEELNTDTRTFLFIEMFNDMSESERWMGRGALGKYYSPYFYITKEQGIEGGDSDMRSTNEIGYLHMVLKGGYIMMILYVLILIPAAYLGIFKSNNILSRMSGYFILTNIIMFFVVDPPEYIINFFILWMAVGTAISPSIRKLKNHEIMYEKEGRLVLEK